MSPFLADWLNLLLRWGHMIAGIAWIGTSFYFVALDFSLKKKEGLAGEAWEVHGGGFYHVQKYLSAPPSLPDHLIWFKWEAYLTWVTGFLLLVVQYYVQASTYLIDPSIMDMEPWVAIAISLAAIFAGWIIYNLLCRAGLGQNLLLGAVFVLILAASYGFTHVYSGRGAIIHVGVFIGTIMAANVFAVIIPNQRRITAALLRGETPDPRLGATGKQRSLHNTYLTLPVLLMMVSNHYPMITNHPQSWLLMGLVIVGGALLRHYLLRTEVGDAQSEIAWTLPLLALVLAAALFLTEPPQRPAYTGEVSDADALAIVQNRCVSCHAAVPTDRTIKTAPKNVILESLDDIKRYAAQIEIQSVRTRAMPMGNKTNMTQQERAQLGAWIAKQ